MSTPESQEGNSELEMEVMRSAHGLVQKFHPDADVEELRRRTILLFRVILKELTEDKSEKKKVTKKKKKK